MGDVQHLLPLTIGHSHGVCCGGTVTTTGVSTSFLHFRLLVFFRVLLVFTLTNGLLSEFFEIDISKHRFLDISCAAWTICPFYSQVSRNFYARDEAGIVILDSRPAQLAELPHSEFGPKLFPHSAYVKFFVTFATKKPYLTFWDKMWQILI